MPHILHVFVLFQHIQKLGHAANVIFVGHGDIVLRHHLDLSALESIAFLLQRFYYIIKAVGICGDLEHGAVSLHILGAGFQRVHHHSFLVQFLVLVVNDDDALAVKGPADAALRAHALAELIEIVAHFRSGTLAVVGQRLHDNGYAAGTVSLVSNSFIVIGIAGAQRLVDGALDVVVGHIGRLGLGHHGGQTGVIIGVAAAALFYGHDDLFCDLGKRGAALGISRALGLLNIVPFGMSGHSLLLLYAVLDDLTIMHGRLDNSQLWEGRLQPLQDHRANDIFRGKMPRVDQVQRLCVQKFMITQI